jgi:hypothetical protein
MDRYFIKNTNFGQFECHPRIKTIEEYNKLVNDIIDNTAGCIEPVIRLAKEYIAQERFSSGGSLHEVLSDYNIRDIDVAFCLGVASANNDVEGSDIASLMLAMTMKQREKLLEGLYD